MFLLQRLSRPRYWYVCFVGETVFDMVGSLSCLSVFSLGAMLFSIKLKHAQKFWSILLIVVQDLEVVPINRWRD